jgi:hypothetical protein
VAVKNTLAYNINEFITTVKCFVVQVPGGSSCFHHLKLPLIPSNKVAVKFRIQKFVHGREKLKGLLVLFPEKHTSLTHLYINLIIVLKRGAQKLAGYNLKVVWAEFSTLSKVVLLCM